MAIAIEQTRCSPCAARRVAGLGALGEGNFIDSFFGGVTKTVSTVWNDITGASANKAAQENALALQRIQAEQAIAEAKARSETLRSVVPWVAGGAAVLIGAVIAMKVLK